MDVAERRGIRFENSACGKFRIFPSDQASGSWASWDEKMAEASLRSDLGIRLC